MQGKKLSCKRENESNFLTWKGRKIRESESRVFTFANVSLAHETPQELRAKVTIDRRLVECFLDKTMAMLVGQGVVPDRAGGCPPVSATYAARTGTVATDLVRVATCGVMPAGGIPSAPHTPDFGHHVCGFWRVTGGSPMSSHKMVVVWRLLKIQFLGYCW